jgi:hypothetical protein
VAGGGRAKEAIAYIQHDELVEVTSRVIRIRKRYLDPHERKRQSRKAEAAYGEAEPPSAAPPA